MDDSNGQKGALSLLAMAEVIQVMSGFLPSPTTAYMGGADPARIQSLRIDEVLGTTMALAIAGSIAYMEKAPGVFIGSAAILGVFLFRYEYALRKAINDGNTNGQGHSGWGGGY